MTESKHRENVIHAAGSLHPLTCGSSVRYAARVRHGKTKGWYIDMDVHLTDCNRQITWSAWTPQGMKDMDEKLATAVKALQGARRAAKEALRLFERKRGKKQR